MIGLASPDVHSISQKWFFLDSNITILMCSYHRVWSHPWDGQFWYDSSPLQGHKVPRRVFEINSLLVLPEMGSGPRWVTIQIFLNLAR